MVAIRDSEKSPPEVLAGELVKKYAAQYRALAAAQSQTSASKKVSAVSDLQQIPVAVWIGAAAMLLLLLGRR